MTSYILWDINPGVFPGVEFFRWYGVCWILGTLLGYRIMRTIYKAEGIPAVELDKLTGYAMIGAIVGARFGHVLFYDPVYYLHNPIEILPFKLHPFQFTGLTGLASHGGILGALMAIYMYSRMSKRDYVWLLDRVAIAGAALGGFIRLGNLMNSEIIGTPSQLPWAFIFIRVDEIPRHPSQLYEAVIYFIISGVLYLLWKSGKFSTNRGFIVGLGVVLIFSQRFLVEFLKENQVPFEEALTLNMGQLLSIPLILAGLGMLTWSLRSGQPTE